MTTPRRRWSFGLRTLFVVVTGLSVPAAWVGAQVKWKADRENYLTTSGRVFGGYENAPPLPLGLSMLGADYVDAIVLEWTVTDEDVAFARRLFPESRILIARGPEDDHRPRAKGDPID